MGSQTVEIQSFISQDPLAVLLPVSCSCERALREVASKLEIRGDSLEVFALFCGKLGHPIRVLQPSDTVPMATELSLQRWYMRSDEAKVIKQDDKAIHCLYMEAKHKLTTGDLQPTAEQMEELETFSDPLFPTERQFLEVARQVSGYNSVVVRQCIVNEEIHDNSCVLSVGSLVTVSMDIEGLSVRGKTGDLHWPWTVVRRWKRVTSSQTNVIKFEVSQTTGLLLMWTSCDMLLPYCSGMSTETECWNALLDRFRDPSGCAAVSNSRSNVCRGQETARSAESTTG